jgi:hypothetical protein
MTSVPGGTPLIVSLYELEALVSWHREQQHACSEKKDYVGACFHKARGEELDKMNDSNRRQVGHLA